MGLGVRLGALGLAAMRDFWFRASAPTVGSWLPKDVFHTVFCALCNLS